MVMIKLSDKQADIFQTWLLLRLEEYHTKGYSGNTINLVDVLTDVVTQIYNKEKLK